MTKSQPKPSTAKENRYAHLGVYFCADYNGRSGHFQMNHEDAADRNGRATKPEYKYQLLSGIAEKGRQANRHPNGFAYHLVTAEDGCIYRLFTDGSLRIQFAPQTVLDGFAVEVEPQEAPSLRLTPYAHFDARSSVKENVSLLKRPYIALSVDEYRKLSANPAHADVFIDADGNLYSYGEADNGFALMPIPAGFADRLDRLSEK